MFLKARSHQKVLAAVIACTGAGYFAASAQATIVVDLGNSGWQAMWDDSFGSGPGALISINNVAVDFGAAGGQGAVFFQKSAEFRQGPVNGVFPSIPIVFRQKPGHVGPTVQNLVIDDEIITNNTGVGWTDFHMDLLDHGEVWFDTLRTATSGGPVGGTPGVNQQLGFSTAPFANSEWNNFVNGDPLRPMRIDMNNGLVPNGDVFFPGDGATDGQLWMHVSALTGSTLFVLKETPTPAPGAIALLAIGAIVGGGRRRRS